MKDYLIAGLLQIAQGVLITMGCILALKIYSWIF